MLGCWFFLSVIYKSKANSNSFKNLFWHVNVYLKLCHSFTITLLPAKAWGIFTEYPELERSSEVHRSGWMLMLQRTELRLNSKSKLSQT